MRHKTQFFIPRVKWSQFGQWWWISIYVMCFYVIDTYVLTTSRLYRFGLGKRGKMRPGKTNPPSPSYSQRWTPSGGWVLKYEPCLTYDEFTICKNANICMSATRYWLVSCGDGNSVCSRRESIIYQYHIITFVVLSSLRTAQLTNSMGIFYLFTIFIFLPF